jgi:tetratricopeptide (TPR) repeat protein
VRKMAVRMLFLLVLFATFPALAEDPRLIALVKQGDAEERAGRTRDALVLYRDAEQIDARNVGVLLRISKQYSDLISTAKPREIAHQLAQKSLLYAERAVGIDPKVAKGHLSVAIAYGKLTDFVGNKEKLEYSKRIKQEALKSIALDPADDFAWHVLGRWHAGVANVSGVLKMMAGLVYGGMPAASNEEAAKCLKKAAELAPQRIIHHSELARVYELMGRKELAEKQWRTVLALPAVDKEDEKDQGEARKVLALPKIAPLPATAPNNSTSTTAR